MTLRELDSRDVLNQLERLKPVAVRTLINDLRCDTEPDEALADGLIDYYRRLKAKYISTNVIQAICYHGTHRHLAFMLGEIRSLAEHRKDKNLANAFISAVRGAGYLGDPEDIEALMSAGSPWCRCNEVYEIARAVALMLVKRDGLATKDFDTDHFGQVRSYSSDLGKGPKGFITEAKERLLRSLPDEPDFANAVIAELSRRFTTGPENHGFMGFSWTPRYRTPQTLCPGSKNNYAMTLRLPTVVSAGNG